MIRALVLGAGGFIGGHLVRRLKREGCFVCGVDLKAHPYTESEADQFVVGDLRDQVFAAEIMDRRFDEVYQLAADMGGAGYIFTGAHDARIMHNSASINLNVLDAAQRRGIDRIFYASSACIYPAHNQEDPDNPDCRETSAYPAAPDSEYGWEKPFFERLYLSYNRNFGMKSRIARYHNVFGPEGAWDGGREKAPAAICRKVAMAKSGETVEVWGDGLQTRSFLYVDECVEGTLKILRCGVQTPLNLGSDEMISIDNLVRLIAAIAGKSIDIAHKPGPLGVRGRNSNNDLIQRELGWRPSAPLVKGLEATYAWIESQVRAKPAWTPKSLALQP
jgi:nucleoside-diphosphate-sugar epimerase